MITKLSIKNFKSIKELDIDCARVNLFIGEPNTGKSNILEALGLLSWCGCDGIGLNDFVRFEDVNNLFYDNITNQIPEVKIVRKIATESIDLNVYLGFMPRFENYIVYVGKYTEPDPPKSFELRGDHQTYLDNEILTESLLINFTGAGIKLNEPMEISVVKPNQEWLIFDNQKIYSIKRIKDTLHVYESGSNFRTFKNLGNLSEFNGYQHFLKFIKLYRYKQLDKFPDKNLPELICPYGSNLLSLIMKSGKIRETASSLFGNFGFKVMFREHIETIEQAKIMKDVIYSHPYITVSDTLKRMLFFNIAIDSNQNSTLVFEEPEVHTFPTYIKQLGEKIAFDETNQYFIVTHNPYLFLSIAENVQKKEDINVFMTSMKDYETKVKLADEKEFAKLMRYDPFFNLLHMVGDKEG